MKYRVTIFKKEPSVVESVESICYFDEEYLATALYRAAVLHEHPAIIQKISKGRYVRMEL